MTRPSLISALVVCSAVLAASPLDAQTGRGRGFAPASGPIEGVRGFSVVLVQGDLKSGTAPGDTVPAAAAKALADLKDFLPYKNYRLLDTQWTMGSGHMTGRLLGPDGRSYDIELDTQRGSSDAPVYVSKFLLHESGFRGMTVGRGGLVGAFAANPARGQDTQGRSVRIMPNDRALIDTSFTMDVGETVVVGTSRLQGDTALIVLLTAVSRTGATRGR